MTCCSRAAGAGLPLVVVAAAVHAAYAIAVSGHYPAALLASSTAAASAAIRRRYRPAELAGRGRVDLVPALRLAVVALYVTVVGIRWHAELAAPFDTEPAQVPSAAYFVLLLLAGLWATAAICAGRGLWRWVTFGRLGDMRHKPWQATISCGAALVAAVATQTAIRPPTQFTAALGPATVDRTCLGVLAILAVAGVRAARALGRAHTADHPAPVRAGTPPASEGAKRH